MNAVFERDYVSFSSSARFLMLRGGFAAGMGLLLLMNILPAYTSGNYADVGTKLMWVAVGLGAVLLALAAPGSFGTVLVSARTSNSLPILLSTPLTPLSIAGGAFLARAGLLMILVLATWPPIALALLFGGVRGSQVFEASAAASATVLLLGAPSFLISAYAKRTASAVVTAYLVAASVIAGLWLAGFLLIAKTSDATIGAVISPIHAIQQALNPQPPDLGTFGDVVPGAYLLLLLAVLLSIGAVVLAAARLAREGRSGGYTAPVLLRRTCRPLRMQNPVLEHELRRGTLLSRRSPARGLLALLIATEGAYVLAVSMGYDAHNIRIHLAVLAFELLLLLLAVAAAGATALSHEKETNTLPLLRAAPLPPSQVVIGKLAGVLRGLLPCLMIPLLHLVWATVQGVFHPLAIPAMLVTGTVSLSAWAVFALYQSLDQRSPQRAVARTMTLLGIIAVLLTANVGVPALGILKNTEEFVRWTAAFGANPVAATLLPVTIFRTGGSSVETALVPPPTGGDIATGSMALLVWIVLHLVFAHALYRRLARLYKVRIET